MFINKYYEYDGKQEIKDKGLTIGGYESACIGDLVAAFVLENSKELFKDAIYNGIYRDDGLVIIIDGAKSNAEIREWLNTFQKRMNITTGHKGLKSSQSVSGEKIWTTM
jgi:hypothetical protein